MIVCVINVSIYISLKYLNKHVIDVCQLTVVHPHSGEPRDVRTGMADKMDAVPRDNTVMYFMLHTRSE